jgi:hypothetical protein
VLNPVNEEPVFEDWVEDCTAAVGSCLDVGVEEVDRTGNGERVAISLEAAEMVV